MEPLTPKQKRILDFIKDYIARYGYPPSIPEMAQTFGCALSTIHGHLENLEKKGYLRLPGNRARGLVLLEAEDADTIAVPLVGYVAAGAPVEIFEHPFKSITLSKELVPEGSVAFKVSGTSMIEEGIFDDDILVVQRREDIKKGELAVVEVEDEGVTVKRLEMEGDMVRLVPSNLNLQPKVYPREKVRIIGAVVLLLRSYRKKV